MPGLARWVAVAALVPSLTAVAAVPAVPSRPAPGLSAAQIVAKNVAARGGLEAWRNVSTMVWVGRMLSTHAPAPSMQFVLEQERPNKTHFEINAMGERSLRVFDGAHGWKLRPSRDSKPEVQPYTIQELKFAQEAQGIDGPLIDYEAKGNVVALEGIDDVEGRKAFRLSVRLASGESRHVWIDVETFLDVKYDRMSYGPGGVSGIVSVFHRDFRTVDGLQMPFVIETGVGSGKQADKMVIEKITINAPLDDRVFARPGPRSPMPKARETEHASRIFPGPGMPPVAPGPAPEPAPLSR